MPALIHDRVADCVELAFILDSGRLHRFTAVFQSCVLGRFNIGLAGNHPDSTVTDGERFVISCWHVDCSNVDAILIGDEGYRSASKASAGFGRGREATRGASV